ncbi:MAG: tRNA (adenosine(37)-N6)-threonylcarbamoyltransferase complex dimerization subunit type 1 TsaB [Bryobacterales bacterium]|nr:tRNA (adenosine(37)-N6)-threonylcarbamoyltransferase complex dimerization subunit type 1 TsaB [Bryobacterales bacterium]
MILVAVDSSGEYGSLAVWREGELTESVVHAPEGFAHVLFPELEKLLVRCGVSLGDVDAFAAASGPGSFTGVRVALSAAKGLAEALGRPLFACSNLEAMALLGQAPLRAPLLDARRGEIYGGLYDSGLRALRPELVQPLAAWLDGLPEGAEILCPYPERFKELSGRAVSRVPAGVAAAVARRAVERFRAGERPVAAEADANYVRRSDAEMNWREA